MAKTARRRAVRSKRPAGSTPENDEGLGQECRDFIASYQTAGFAVSPSEALYCLPSSLLDCISERTGRIMIKSEHNRLERSFAGWCRRHCAIGVFADRPVPLGLLDMAEITRRNRHREQVEAYRRRPNRAVEPEPYKAPLEAVLLSRLRGYAAWLLTNLEYQRDLCELRRDTEANAVRLGFPPPMRPGGSPDASGWPAEILAKYVAFCRRWCLAGLLSWELPLPMEPQVLTDPCSDPQAMKSGGLALFLPVTVAIPVGYWDTVVPDVRQSAIAANSQSGGRWAHLRPWLDGSYAPDPPVDYGDFFIVRHYWRVLFGRYGRQLGQGIRMDLYEAFAKFLEGPGTGARKEQRVGVRQCGTHKVRRMITYLRRLDLAPSQPG